MTTRSHFQQKLTEACERAGCVHADGRVNVYRLARMVDPVNPPERLIRMWLSPRPPRPSAASLDALSGVLGVPPSFFVEEMSEAMRRQLRNGRAIAKVLMRS